MAYPNWGDARIQNSQYVAEKYREEMRKPKYVHLGANPMITSGGNEGKFLPSGIVLHQNFPNPFNPSTTITYSLSEAAIVSLRIFHVLGQEVGILVNERKEAGTFHVVWNANVPSGIYFYRLQACKISGGQAGGYTETKKKMILR